MSAVEIKSVCVYCASSRAADPRFAEAATRLGGLLAERGVTLVYGGGAVGSMGAVADGALAAGGRVVGVLPEFMDEVEWGHPGLTELILVDDMHQRKRRMLEGVDATIALPGGVGTLEELLEAITWKRLGLFHKPIVIVNVLGYFDPLIETLNRTVDEKFMGERHRDMWRVVDSVDGVFDAIADSPEWGPDARGFALQ